MMRHPGVSVVSAKGSFNSPGMSTARKELAANKSSVSEHTVKRGKRQESRSDDAGLHNIRVLNISS